MTVFFVPSLESRSWLVLLFGFVCASLAYKSFASVSVYVCWLIGFESSKMGRKKMRESNGLVEKEAVGWPRQIAYCMHKPMNYKRAKCSNVVVRSK